MEIVLSVDNLVVIAILVGRLKPEQQSFARKLGMTLALVPRLLLLLVIGWVLSLTQPLFNAFGHALTGKDLIMIAGGGFLIYKAVHEIHGSLEGVEGEATAGKVYGSLGAVISQIAIINLVFSIDSIVTAVGLATEIWVMAVAVILSMIVLMVAAKPVGDFVEEHPTVKMLALSFLVMIGTTLVADGFGVHFSHAFIYVSMAFSVAVEMLNLVMRKRTAKVVHLRNQYGPTSAAGDAADAVDRK
ncbi:MAG TPA: TerC family protein [Herpetosiphonaceae bacterium]|nr:TerC family protein [Herpetosiphonaceae bacterium]